MKTQNVTLPSGRSNIVTEAGGPEKPVHVINLMHLHADERETPEESMAPFHLVFAVSPYSGDPASLCGSYEDFVALRDGLTALLGDAADQHPKCDGDCGCTCGGRYQCVICGDSPS